jgi:DNA transformation protein
MKLGTLKNIGPKTERWLNALGLYTRADLQRVGPVAVYEVLKGEGHPVSTVLLYALQGALTDVHWNALPEALKERLRREAQSAGSR